MTTPHALASEPIDPELIEDYARRGASPPAIENRRKAALRFTRLHNGIETWACLLYTSPSPRDRTRSRMPSSA